MSVAQLFFSFDGRINRTLYWSAFLVLTVLTGVMMVLVGLATVVIGPSGGARAVWIATCASGLLMSYPGFAITVKRLHDRNRSGWWLFALTAFQIVALLLPLFAIAAMTVSALASSALLLLSFAASIGTIWMTVEVWFFAGASGDNSYGGPARFSDVFSKKGIPAQHEAQGPSPSKVSVAGATSKASSSANARGFGRRPKLSQV